ncbi:hypothetical protein CASFOL_018587 [Castilleja foliolosa]|uniref:Uncharacterized protein n=1 Tax=Castilleja foliolosa TaxID=1961234 RepID=A0ABD3D8A2_9LAMI
MQKFRPSLLLPFTFPNRHWDVCRRSHPLSTKSLATSAPQVNSKNVVLADFLTDSLKFPKTTAVAVSSCFPCTTSLDKPKAVVRFLKSLGFSDTQIQSSIKRQPSILFADVEKNLKPKIEFFRELGLRGPRLGILISKNSALLTSSLDNKLKPSIGVIKRFIELHGGQKVNDDDLSDLMFRILSRYCWVIANDSRLQSNMIYLQRCGIVGSQLIMVLKTELRLFSLSDDEMKNLVLRAVEMGFEMGSRMLVYAVLALYSNSPETINKKIKLLQSLGFTKDECNEMFVKSPVLFKRSEAKLRRVVEFLINSAMLDKSVIVGTPTVLGLSMEKRIIPRFKVLQMIKSMNLFVHEPSFFSALFLTDKKFVENYILRFNDDEAKKLQVTFEKLLLSESS